MMVVLSGQPREWSADIVDDEAMAITRRARLTRVLAVLGVIAAGAVVAALVLPPAARRTYLIAICLALVLCGVLPLLASLLQYIVVGLHRYFIGYDELHSYYPRVAVVVPAWNEEQVIGTTIERLLAMDYPQDCLRVYVVDDASTDGTPDVVRGWVARVPDRVRHLRRAKGGEGKAHTLNHGISLILAEPWAEALLIIDADVLFEDSALRRMTRHLSRPDVGAVTAYIKEGTAGPNFLNRFIGYEYITAQAAARRAQNVFGALACLAGGAQLHSRENLNAIGGRIDTSTLAEDTVTTFRTQLSGKRVVFEANAVVWAEEPGDLVGLWKQRLRWARGNVQISLQFSHMWFHGRKYGALSRGLFAFIWFTVLLMPIFMIMVAPGLVGLYMIDSAQAWSVFRSLWIFHAVIYAFVTAMSFTLDPATARRSWLQGILFPGVVSLGIMIYSVAPATIGAALTHGLAALGIEVTPALIRGSQLFIYGWLAGSMVVAYIGKWTAAHSRWSFPSKLLLYLSGYGSFLCAVTFAAYVREFQRARLTWEKTIKTGKVVVAK